jgi:hypothetical protein
MKMPQTHGKKDRTVVMSELLYIEYMVENVGAGAPNLKKSQKNPILNVYF